jgi:two-component system phosphate regulon sensor histidine kinase PhoR
VGNDSLGVFGVALPSNFFVQAGATNRTTYFAVFFALMVAVVVIGYAVSQRITSPLGRLVRTSRAVAEGDLDQRTGIASADEIGMLAATFDEMTGRLAERTRALEEALGRMRAILSSIGDGVLLEDLDKNLVPLNTAAETLMEEMSANFLLGPLREMSVREQDRSPRPETTPWVLERRRFEVGKKVISAHSAAVRTEDGEFLGTVIVLRDVTAEAETERLKDAFVAHVSHELRTPLTAIKGYIELMLAGATGNLNQEQRGSMETIHRHTENLVAMINALLDFSEIEAWSRLTIQRRPVVLTELVQTIAEEWRSRMEEKDLEFQVEISQDLPTVNADDRRLRWAFINLVRNAWQYTDDGGSVTVRLYQDNNHLILDVTDTGVGISQQDQARIFERFSRAGNMTYSNVRGLGLGLYVTKAIIESHGGEIRVSSVKGEGSTFSIVLPVVGE